ncbi:LacI family DNA-binding transcriptional regulator [Rhodohalobacter sp. 8-1]|uniref:LacI family DNA-binding transcriptional regulator n=1 Tax=Rhodohalobacter sp. 8-1 TaxID=3131972 RepID=UPI0030EDE7E1
MEKLNIDKVAKLAHVSRSVVSRVLNDHPNVSDVARERVMKVVNKYNYRPNSVARSLATNSTHEIGVLVTQSEDEALGSAFWMQLHRGIFEESKKRGYFVSLSYVPPRNKEELNNFILNDRRLDGYILLTQEVTNMVGRELFDKNVPIVLVGHVPRKKQVSSVDVDNVKGGRLAAEHLLGLGHEKIGVMLASLDMKESKDRLKGLREAHLEAGIELSDDRVEIVDYQFRAGYQTMKKWIESEIDITAVFCASDTIAMGALLAAREHGKKVPEDYAVIGFDDLSFAEFTYPPLTTIHQPILKKGKMAAKLLIDEIEDKDSGRHKINLDPQLVIRESCGARKN